MMMITDAMSWESFLGILSFSVQIILASIIIYEQTRKEFFGTDMSIPMRVKSLTRVAQFLAVVLALMTQNELLGGLRTIFTFPYHDKLKWGKICSIHIYDCTLPRWLLRVLLPNAMKAIQGSMILVASFILIVQLTSTVDVLKDYSALFIVSSMYNFFFDYANKGYFGKQIMQKAEKVSNTEFEENEVDNWLRSIAIMLAVAFVSAWSYIFAGHTSGKYVGQAYPLCNLDTKNK